MPANKNTAIASLLVGALVWGLIWQPYRVLEHAGVSAILAATLTYVVAFVFGAIVLHRHLRGWRFSWLLLAIALAGGGCNMGYVLATVHGVVMRVLLLFYLAPLWTVLLSRLMLGERLNAAGVGVVALSLGGAVVMLWQPSFGLPLPQNGAEWIGLVAGFLFALTNVLIRKTTHLSIELKSMAIFSGVIALGLMLLPFEPLSLAPLAQTPAWLRVLLVGVVLLAVNLVVQFGLTHTPANQAIVIFLFELVVAAISSWLLAGEVMGMKEWLGGAMIIAASLFSGRMETRHTPDAG